MTRQDHDAPELHRDRGDSIRNRTALWLTALFTPSIRTLLHASLPANDCDGPEAA